MGNYRELIEEKLDNVILQHSYSRNREKRVDSEYVEFVDWLVEELDKARKGAKKEESKKLYQSISKELYKLYSDIEYLGDLRDEVYNLSDKYEKLFKLTTK